MKNYVFKGLKNGGSFGIGTDKNLKEIVDELFDGEMPIIDRDNLFGQVFVYTKTERYQVLEY